MTSISRNRRTYENLMDLLQDLVKHAPNGLTADQVAERLGKAYPTLMNELNPAIDSHKFGLQLLIPLMEIVNSDLPAHYIAGARGGVFVRLPKSRCVEASAQHQCLIAVKEFGELVAQTADALSDNRLTEQDRKAILREGREAVTAIMVLLKLMEVKNG